jgi:hypothetical protein
MEPVEKPQPHSWQQYYEMYIKPAKMKRVDACEDIKNMTQEQYDKLVKEPAKKEGDKKCLPCQIFNYIVERLAENFNERGDAIPLPQETDIHQIAHRTLVVAGNQVKKSVAYIPEVVKVSNK